MTLHCGGERSLASGDTRRSGQVFGRVIHHGPATGSEPTLPITMIEAPLGTSLVAGPRAPLASSPGSPPTPVPAIHLTSITIGTEVEKARAPRTPSLSERHRIAHPLAPADALKTCLSLTSKRNMLSTSADGPGLQPWAIVIFGDPRSERYPPCDLAAQNPTTANPSQIPTVSRGRRHTRMRSTLGSDKEL